MNSMMRLLACMSFVFLLTHCVGDVGEENVEVGKSAESVNVEAHLVVLGTMTNTIERAGNIVVKEKVNVTAHREDVIDKIYVKESDYVRKGRTLFQLEVIDLEIAKDQALSEKIEAQERVTMSQVKLRDEGLRIEKKIKELEKEVIEIELNQLKVSNKTRILNNKLQLYQSDGIAKEEFLKEQFELYEMNKSLEIQKENNAINRIGYRDEDIVSAGYKVPMDEKGKVERLKEVNTMMARAEQEAAESRLANAELKLKSIDRQLELSVVKSPVSGIVAQRSYDEGERAEKGKPVFVIIDTSRLYVQVSLPETFLGYVKRGDSIEFSRDIRYAEKRTTTIKIISPILDPQSRTFSVKGEFINRQGYFKPGMFVKTKIISNQKTKGFFIKDKYISEIKDGRGVIFKHEDGQAKKVTVELGEKINEHYQVLSGLKVGDAVLVSSVPLQTGMKVKISKKTRKVKE